MKTTTINEVRRNYKKIVEELNKTNEPIIVISANKPQFVLISMELLQKIQKG